VKAGIVLFDELEYRKHTMQDIKIHPRSLPVEKQQLPDESEIRSFGLIPIEFDKPDDQIEGARDLIMRRGVI